MNSASPTTGSNVAGLEGLKAILDSAAVPETKLRELRNLKGAGRQLGTLDAPVEPPNYDGWVYVRASTSRVTEGPEWYPSEARAYAALCIAANDIFGSIPSLEAILGIFQGQQTFARGILTGFPEKNDSVAAIPLTRETFQKLRDTGKLWE